MSHGIWAGSLRALAVLVTLAMALSGCASTRTEARKAGATDPQDDRDPDRGAGDGGSDRPIGSGPLGRLDGGDPHEGDSDGGPGTTDLGLDSGSAHGNDPDPMSPATDDAPGTKVGMDAGLDGGRSDAGRDDGMHGDAGADGGGDQPTQEEFCAGGGPAVNVPDNVLMRDVCTPDLGRRLFSRALCTCEQTNFAGYLKTRSFDSNAPLLGIVERGAAVGINGALVSGSYVDVGGSMTVIGPTSFAGYLKVGGDLELQQNLALPGYLRVARDAWLAGDSALTAATIGRDLLTQPGKLQPPPWAMVGGMWSTGTFGFEPPCACEPGDLLDIEAIIVAGQAHNDNGRIGLAPRAFDDHIGYARWTLPCGRFYLDEITGIGDLTLRVEGRTALYVKGDVGITGKFEIELAPGAELDLFVGGNLVQIGYGVFGDPSRPADLRVYVAGDQDILYLGYQPVAANLYAPRARLVSAGYIDLDGSLFAREVLSAGYIDVTYDRAVLEPEDCTPPVEDPPECDRCEHTCGQGACVDGHCGPCQDDDDCCGALVCYEDGRCGPLLD